MGGVRLPFMLAAVGVQCSTRTVFSIGVDLRSVGVPLLSIHNSSLSIVFRVN